MSIFFKYYIMRSKDVYKGVVKESLFDELGIPLTPEMQKSYGLINGGYETLLCRIFNDKYKCLTNGNVYGEDRINLDSLVPFRRMIDCGRYITEKKTMQLYKDFLHREFLTNLLFVGKVVLIYDYDINDNIMTEGDIMYHGTLTDIKFKCRPVKKAILYKLDENTYLDLENYVKYKTTDLDLDQLTVIDCYPFVIDDIEKNKVMEQEKVLKKFRQNSY